MLAEMKTAAGVARIAFGILVGVLLGWAVTLIFTTFITIPAARDAGRIEERTAWEKAREEDRQKAEADQRAAQAKIDTLERDYHEKQAEHAGEMAALEAALEAEKADDAVPRPTPSPGAPCSCRPAISRGVRDRLQELGRTTAPRTPSAGPQTPLR